MKTKGIFALICGVALIALPVFPAVGTALASEEAAAEEADAEFEAADFEAPDFEIPDFEAPEFEDPRFEDLGEIRQPFDENPPEVEAPRFDFEAPLLDVDLARPEAEDRLPVADAREVEQPEDDLMIPRVRADRVRPEDPVRRAEVPEVEEREIDRVFPRKREFPVRERFENRFFVVEPEIEIEFDPRIQNVFVFNTVATNVVLGRPLFGLDIDPRVWTIGRAIAELKVTGEFRADLFDVRVGGRIAFGHFVGAGIFCRNGTLAHQTSLFPVDEFGQVRIRDILFLPADCASPIVALVNEEERIVAAAGLGFLGPTGDFG